MLFHASVLVLALCGLVCSHLASGRTIQVLVTVRYPESNLGPGVAMGLRGSSPLQWNVTTGLTYTAQDTWVGKFAVEQPFNSTYPTYGIDMKAFAGEATWQLGCNERLTLSGSSPDVVSFTIYPWFEDYQGVEFNIDNVYSPQLNNTRSVWIYVPPGLVENPLRVESNVLIMHDGQNLSPLWNVSGHLDNLIMGGKMESVFVIGPYNTPDRIAEYTYCADPQYGGGKGDLYLDFLADTLLPMIAQNFSIATNQSNLGILGSSLGGLISCYAGVTRPATYKRVGCMSSSFWWDSANFFRTIVPQLSVQTNVQLYDQMYHIDSGDSGVDDDERPRTSQVATAFAGQGGFTLGENLFYYVERGGQHNEYFWSKRFHHVMEWLYYRDALWNGD